MKRKYMNTDNAQWKDPELTTLISEVGGSVAIGNPERHERKASHCGSKLQ